MPSNRISTSAAQPQKTSASAQPGSKAQSRTASSSSTQPDPRLSALRQPPHTIADVQDAALAAFKNTTGNSKKIANAATSAEGQALRKLPATAENITKLAEFENKAANAPGDATSADTLAASVGYMRNGVGHMVASTAALGAKGPAGVHAAGYTDELIESQSSNF